MFERRLRVFLVALVVIAAALLVRAVQLQVVQRSHWTGQAEESLRRGEELEPMRGRILDVRGREIAVDEACVDAAVDFRAIPRNPDPAWVRSVALGRLRKRPDYLSAEAQTRRQMLEDEQKLVRTQIDILWATLASVSGSRLEEIDEIRANIERRVMMRNRYLWFRRYQKALEERAQRPPSPAWYKWLLDDSAEAPDIDAFRKDVEEQREAHTILRAIDPSVQNLLGANAENLPGLVLKRSRHRVYPYRNAAAHVIGTLSMVRREDLATDAALDDPLRRYQYNDLIGRSGLEALCEPLLRGTRGRVERSLGEDSRVLERIEPVHGRDVTSTIDIELQADVQKLFTSAKVDPSDPTDRVAVHGAAVVIDVPTGEVRVMASYPDFDLNRYDEDYQVLVGDRLGNPLLNRATQYPLVPGSSIKPVIGLGAVTQGRATASEGIECTGFMMPGGKRYMLGGRCWTASRYARDLGIEGVKHHPMPVPHVGSGGNPNGFLNLADALERSCNVYFETLAERLGLDGVRYWFERFGLGRPTGVGIAEWTGEIPGDLPVPITQRRAITWFAGIGQGQVTATCVQMANVAATIARGGVWVRPRLVREAVPGQESGPERVDLRLSPEALAATREGMIRVVHSRAGTGASARHPDLVVAGKTGTAQAHPLMELVLDGSGKPLRDANGRLVRRPLQISTKGNPNPRAPWYRGSGLTGTDLSHAWFIAFAPAENPQVALAVMVEYGGSGGHTAGSLASEILEACIEHGYLARR